MRLPIQYATLPGAAIELAAEVRPGAGWNAFLEPPDSTRFPAIRLAYQAAEAGGSLPAVFSAANEEAVRLFLEGKIRFGEIARRIEGAMERHRLLPAASFEEILAVDRWAREAVTNGRGTGGEN